MQRDINQFWWRSTKIERWARSRPNFARTSSDAPLTTIRLVSESPFVRGRAHSSARREKGKGKLKVCPNSAKRGPKLTKVDQDQPRNGRPRLELDRAWSEFPFEFGGHRHTCLDFGQLRSTSATSAQQSIARDKTHLQDMEATFASRVSRRTHRTVLPRGGSCSKTGEVYSAHDVFGGVPRIRRMRTQIGCLSPKRN